MSPATRKRIVALRKRRWAKWRKAQKTILDSRSMHSTPRLLVKRWILLQLSLARLRKLCGRWREIAISNNVGVNHFPSILQHGYSGNLFRPVQHLSDHSDGVKCSRNQGMWGGDRLRAEVGGVGPRHVRAKGQNA
jgi:hypothetical protein